MVHMKQRYYHYRRGFTLIELLVVVLILSVLMAIAAPLYLSAISDSQRRACRANMQTISNAVQAARVNAISTDYSTIISGGVTTSNLPNLETVPVCPNGGSYSLAIGSSGNANTFQVRCSFAPGSGIPGSAHGTFEPGVNSN